MFERNIALSGSSSSIRSDRSPSVVREAIGFLQFAEKHVLVVLENFSHSIASLYGDGPLSYSAEFGGPTLSTKSNHAVLLECRNLFSVPLTTAPSERTVPVSL